MKNRLRMLVSDSSACHMAESRLKEIPDIIAQMHQSRSQAQSQIPSRNSLLYIHDNYVLKFKMMPRRHSKRFSAYPVEEIQVKWRKTVQREQNPLQSPVMFQSQVFSQSQFEVHVKRRKPHSPSFKPPQPLMEPKVLKTHSLKFRSRGHKKQRCVV